MTAFRPDPIPDRIRREIPRWGPAMRAVRSALKAGHATETSIARVAELDSWTVRGALELLAVLGEVEPTQEARWRGVTLSTARYAGSLRRLLKEQEAS